MGTKPYKVFDAQHNKVSERQRNELLHFKLLLMHGCWQREGNICNLVASPLEALTPLLARLADVASGSRDFR